MKIACFSDLHIHPFKDFDEPSDHTGSTRLDNVLGTVEYIRDYCYDNGIHHVLFGGDAFHTRGKVDTLAFNYFYDIMKTFHDKDIEVLMVAGNHDMASNSETPLHSLHSFNDIEGITVYGDIGCHKFETEDEVVWIACTPYSKNVLRTREFIENLSLSGTEDPVILLGHLGIDGATVGQSSYPMAEAFTVGDLYPDYFKYIVMGHFHTRQFLGKLPHAFYCGAPIQHSFSDEGEDKGFYVIDTKKRYDVQFVTIPNPKFVTLDISGMPSDEIAELLNVLEEEGHYVRVKMSESNIKTFSNNVPQGLKYKVELQKEYKENTRVDVQVGMSFSDIISKYAEEFNPLSEAVGLQILDEVGGDIR